MQWVVKYEGDVEASPSAPSAPAAPSAPSVPASPASPVPEEVRETAPEVSAEAEDEVPLLPVRFEKEKGALEDIFFFAMPLGFDLSKQKPLTVRAVKKESYAEQLGVQVGWKVHSINGVDVSDVTPGGDRPLETYR